MSEDIAPHGKKPRKQILVIDDHPLFRRGLIGLINQQSDLRVCAEAASRQAGLEEMAASQPDLATVPLCLENGNGLELLKDIVCHFPDTPVLVISVYDETVYAERAFRAGAKGFVTKTQEEQVVLTAIRYVLSGRQFMSDAVGAAFAQKYLLGSKSGRGITVDGLSDRELQVFRLIGQGKGTRWIAEHLKLSIKTIETYREHIKSKLTLHSAAELSRAAARWHETGTI
jgi:DNA-binding NarL/FixJ family response regulator